MQTQQTDGEEDKENIQKETTKNVRKMSFVIKKNMINKGNFKTKHEDTIVVLLVRRVKRQSKHTHQELPGLKHS